MTNFQNEYPDALETVFRSPQGEEKSSIEPRYTKLPFQDNSFDVVNGRGLASNVLARYWPDTLQELKRVLKPGGKLEIVAFGSSWINARSSIRLTTQQAHYKRCLADVGYHEELTEALPALVAQSGFTSAQIAIVAMPVGWGVSVTNVSKF